MQIPARPWWRLESGPVEAGPSEIALEPVEFHRDKYRDELALQQIMLASPSTVTRRQPSGPDPIGESDYDPYGVPLTPGAGEATSWAAYFNACLARTNPPSGMFREWFLAWVEPNLFDRFTADEALAAAVPPSPIAAPPPGSLVGIRQRGAVSFYEGVTNLVDRTNTLEHQVWAIGAGLRIYDAQLFWLPGDVGRAILTSDQPDDELLARIRLPFESVIVGLAQPVLASLLGERDDEFWRTAMSTGGEKSALGGEPSVAAVWISAGEDGFGIGPVVVWFVETDVGVSAIPGAWSRSAYSGAVANLAALLTWEHWPEALPPAAPLPDPLSREGRKELKRGSVRRAVGRGSHHRIRVLAIPTDYRSPTERSGDSEDHRSPIRHWRRGHWRRVRVATRGPNGEIVGSVQGEKDLDWSYVGRWIPPTLVNRSGPADPGEKVYRQVATDDLFEEFSMKAST